MMDNPDIVSLFGNDDPGSLAEVMKLAYNIPGLLAACKKNSLSPAPK